MEEVARLCSRAILIDHGPAVADGTAEELIERAGTARRIEVTTGVALTPELASGIGNAISLDDGARFGASLEPTRLDQGPEVYSPPRTRRRRSARSRFSSFQSSGGISEAYRPYAAHRPLIFNPESTFESAPRDLTRTELRCFVR